MPDGSTQTETPYRQTSLQPRPTDRPQARQPQQPGTNLGKIAQIMVAGSLATTALIAALSPGAQAAPGRNGDLSISLSGFKSTQGNVCLQVFSSSRGFPGDQSKAFKGQCLKVTDSTMSVTFRQLPVGSYAIAVLHDINSDGQLNRNMLGIPTEGFGFSRNPVIRTGPPKFGDSAVLVAGPNTQIDIQIHYFGR